MDTFLTELAAAISSSVTVMLAKRALRSLKSHAARKLSAIQRVRIFGQRARVFPGA